VGIEQARLGERLRVTWDVAPDIGSAQLPPMLLQPLVETAIRHGVSKSPAGGCLTIHAWRGETRLAIDVADDGPGFPTRTDEGQVGAGLAWKNTRKRLPHLYGDDCRLELSRDGNWPRVHVELPFHVQAS